ncbi:uncharacterized protein AB675_4444 [Cyphellophora attinorum]|uniref:Uncharacterized protein n=1 Tax=Cyphellophora attinorum TaxID=1664694 RepID=A0A0N0NLG0_9EURO|nr:uncharacterized protein AB675_4444 [Phialophora attinorum]KPI39128.1 hypothetical protein AB675_4444 [Phialophora attinorum]
MSMSTELPCALETTSSQSSGSSDAASLLGLPFELLDTILKLAFPLAYRLQIAHPTWNPTSTFIKQAFLSIEEIESLPDDCVRARQYLTQKKATYIERTIKQVQTDLDKYQQDLKDKLAKLRKTYSRDDLEIGRYSSIWKAIECNDEHQGKVARHGKQILTDLAAGRKPGRAYPRVGFSSHDQASDRESLKSLMMVCRQLRTEVRNFIARNGVVNASTVCDAAWFAATHRGFSTHVASLEIRTPKCEDALPKRKQWITLLLRCFPKLKCLRIDWIKGDYVHRAEDAGSSIVPFDKDYIVHFPKVELQLMEFIMQKSGLDTVLVVHAGSMGVIFGRAEDVRVRGNSFFFIDDITMSVVDVESQLEEMWF